MIKAIETFYKGYYFRSRLEARWAVFFDALGLDWDYEVEGYELSDGRYYLPDFIINVSQWNHPTRPWVYEIKPKNDAGDGKLEQLLKDTHIFCSGTVLSGSPFDVINNNDYIICPMCLNISSTSQSKKRYGYSIIESDEIFLDNTNSNYEIRFHCADCDNNGDCGGKEEYIKFYNDIPMLTHTGDIILLKQHYDIYKNKLLNAAIKARMARFEHVDKNLFI